MSMTTALRFELTGQNESLIKSMNREKERILKDELMAERVKQVEHEANVNLRSEWAEGLEESSYRKKIKQEKKIIKSELKFAGKSIVAVRRAALRNLLEQEHDMYEKELHSKGYAFYVKRV